MHTRDSFRADVLSVVYRRRCFNKNPGTVVPGRRSGGKEMQKHGACFGRNTAICSDGKLQRRSSDDSECPPSLASLRRFNRYI